MRIIILHCDPNVSFVFTQIVQMGFQAMLLILLTATCAIAVDGALTDTFP